MPDQVKTPRRHSRELALKALFFLDMQGDLKTTQHLDEFCQFYIMELPSLQKSFFTELVQGVVDNLDEIDALIGLNSKNWRLARMSFVDRNILRIASFELIHCEDIPWAVSINEAVELGKIYGTKGSGAFINGILDGIRLQIENKLYPGRA